MGFEDINDIFHLVDENDIYLREEEEEKVEVFTTLSHEYLTGPSDNAFRQRMNILSCTPYWDIGTYNSNYHTPKPILSVYAKIVIIEERKELPKKLKDKLIGNNNDRKYNKDHVHRKTMLYKRQPIHQKNCYVKKVR